MHDDDWSLLQEFAQRRSQSAFATLVARHAGMVYSTCMRELRNRQDAEDAAQAVFIVLARKAGTIRRGTVIAAWLYRAAQFAAIHVNRANRRLRVREATAAASVRERQEPAMELGTYEDLDLAMNKLSPQDRAAVLLRFYEERGYQDVAGELNLSVAAAKKRVQRAVERLRALMRSPDGPPVGRATALALLASARYPVPAQLQASILHTVFTPGASAGAAAAIAKGALIMMNVARTKWAALCVTAALALVGVALWAAAETETTAPAPTGVVVDASGRPVAGATIETATIDQHVEAYDPPRPGAVRTDAQGQFALPSNPQKRWIVVKGDGGFGASDTEQLAQTHRITMEPWASIDGTVSVGAKRAAGATIGVMGIPNFDPHFLRPGVVACPVAYGLSTVADSAGHFRFPRLVPGEWSVARVCPKVGFHGLALYPQVVSVPAGKRVSVALGGTGRAVVGRAVLPAGRDRTPGFDPDNYIAGRIAREPPKVDFPGVPAKQYQAVFKKWVLSPAAHEYRVCFAYNYSFPIAADGSFRVDDLPAGAYTLSLNLGNAHHFLKFTVPDMPLGFDDRPLSLGDLELR